MATVRDLPTREWIDDLPAWIEQTDQRDPFTVKTLEADGPVRLVREMASTRLPLTSRWVYALEEADGGCHLTIHVETCFRRITWMVPIWRFVMHLGGGVQKGLDTQIDMVAKTLGVEVRRAS